jgi:hypothetical protein
MGYMGFGMQKENYQRKAKKVFENTGNHGSPGSFKYKKADVPLALKIFRIVVYLIIPIAIFVTLIIKFA